MTVTTGTARGLEDAYPLAALQAGMLYHSAYEPDAATYHDLTTITLRGRFDAGAFEAALAEVTARHPVLRTSFDLTGFSEPLQLVHRAATLPLEVTDLSGDPAAADRLAEWSEAEKRRPFDWASPPLARAYVHVLSGELFAFSLSFHHAILDGWSVAALVTELLQRYHGHLTGDRLPVSPPGAAFRELVSAERAAVAAAETRDFWHAQVADAPDTRLPRLPEQPTEPPHRPGQSDQAEALHSSGQPDHADAEAPRAPGQRGEPEAVVLRLPLEAALLDRLGAVARELAVPLRTLLLAAHLRVLALLTGENEVMTGLVTHSRPESEAGEEVLGLFLNTVPLRLDVTAPSWAALARRVFEAEVALLPHRRYPLFEIQRAAGRSPLLDVLFDFRDFHVYRSLPGVEIVHQEFFEQTDVPFAAAFSRSREHGGFDLTLTYDRAQFGADQVGRIGELYLTALHQAADPTSDPRPADPYLARDAAAIDGWNATARPYPSAALHDLIGEQAARTPTAPAVCYDGIWITYRELTERARAITARLLATGTRPGDVVGVCLERGPDLLPALLGVLGAGAAYLPLEPDLPPERLAYMIEDARARTVLTGPGGAEVLPDGVALALDDPLPDAAVPEADSPPDVHPDALAYVIFTSGSTGRPKGVGVSHRAIVNRLQWMQEAFGLTADERVLHKTPLSFDVSVWELFWPLMVGAGLVVAEPGGHRDSARLAALATAHRVTTAHFVPSMLELFLDEPGLPELRRIICSGEALGPELAARCHDRLPHTELHNLYGPTEAAVDVTWHPCEPGERLVPIGRPVANTRLEVLDADGRRVPVGTPGELCLGGVQLARGYVNRPELTAERFVPDPYGPPGARLYRTGDVARWLPSGEVQYLGRTDFQVKIRGQRVELGEIEALLTADPAVRAAVVVLRGERLVGYVVPESDKSDQFPESDQAPQSDQAPGGDGLPDLATMLRRRLPDHMVPTAWVRLDALPVTANGKLDRGALPEPGDTGRAPYLPPRDPFEAKLGTLWEETLGVDAVGVHDDFFALGGHSLLALRLTMRLRKELGRDVPLSTVLTAPTVAQLAAELRRPQDNDGAPQRIVPLRPGGDRDPVFLFHALGGQVFRYLPLTRHLGPDQPVYAIQAAGLAPGEEPHATLAEMVDDYTAHLLKVRPHGPYVLGGYCIGGNIALETARRLREMGEEVPLVVLFYSDAEEPVLRASLEDDAVLLTHALAGGKVQVDLDDLHRMSPDERLLAVIDAAARADTLQPDTADLRQARRFVEVFRANAHAVGHYRHDPYDGDVLLFSPAAEGVPPDDMGWRNVVTGRLRISPIHGERFTVMYEPRVALAAAELRSSVDHGLTPHD
ncbi:non-ribosomal peptide synthetase [Nonomuraea jiangxiensis]|uniref:Amino acid adenylation domain-containing protein n=1 Tax=Nonomuraea jiangxiensis TaxID=633440 RepID=A0A1G8EJP1_9ACTN|nr:non-ribosomal peptide synthetase [Nonomuraea jiangxiensis]SDH70012.1 amino acid adenylation domain-containing protein [Nonomuraea jiangxiensis]